MKDFLPLIMEYEDFAFASLICAVVCYLILRIDAALKVVNSWLEPNELKALKKISSKLWINFCKTLKSKPRKEISPASNRFFAAIDVLMSSMMVLALSFSMIYMLAMAIIANSTMSVELYKNMIAVVYMSLCFMSAMAIGGQGKRSFISILKASGKKY